MRFILQVRDGQSLNEGVKLLLTHAVREQIVGERLRIVNTRQLCLVADTSIIHQTGVESQRYQRVAENGVFYRTNIIIVAVGDQIVGHNLLVSCAAKSLKQRANISCTVLTLHAMHDIGCGFRASIKRLL